MHNKEECSVLTWPIERHWRVNRLKGGESLCFCERGHRSVLFYVLFVYQAMEVLIISKKELQINEEIREKEIRVVDENGSQLGIMPTREALNLAIQKGLDLVDIAPQATPHVCRIMDYGKYRYEQAKKEKEAKKNQKTVEVKEVRMSMNIDTHDFTTKTNQAIKFLKGGDKVKVSVRFRGREMAHTDLGKALLVRFQEACVEVGSVDKPAKMEGRSMVLFLSPKPVK